MTKGVGVGGQGNSEVEREKNSKVAVGSLRLGKVRQVVQGIVKLRSLV